MQEQHALHERVKMIPKIIHFAWHRLPVTPRWQFVLEAWKQALPDWEVRLWTEDNLPPMKYPEVLASTRNYGEWTDFVRIEALREYGGLYSDTDNFPINGLTEEFFLRQGTMISSELPNRAPGNYADPFNLCNFLMTGTEKDPFWEYVSEQVPGWIKNPPVDWREASNLIDLDIESKLSYSLWKLGPRFIARCVREYHDREWSAPVTEPGRQERVGITLLPPDYTIWFSRNKWFTGEVPPPQPEAATLHLHGGEWVTATSFTPTGNFV